jgi:hypothetical protein
MGDSEQCSARDLDWTWSCVITALWWEEQEGEADGEGEGGGGGRHEQWVRAAVGELLSHPSATGVYSTDLGPGDTALAQHAFSPATLARLAAQKALHDPTNVLAHRCAI